MDPVVLYTHEKIMNILKVVVGKRPKIITRTNRLMDGQGLIHGTSLHSQWVQDKLFAKNGDTIVQL